MRCVDKIEILNFSTLTITSNIMDIRAIEHDIPTIADLGELVYGVKSIVNGQSNDFKCAFERFATQTASDTGKFGYVEKDFNPSNPKVIKFLEEVKGMQVDMETIGEKLLTKQRKALEAVPVCDLETSTCTYGDFSQKLPPKMLEELKKVGTDEEITASLMRIASLNPGGQQWSMPFKWFKAVQKNLGLHLIAYASILNRFPGVPYCSLFEEDKKFGSLGNFHQLDFNAFVKDRKGTTVVTINPPFTETELKYAAEKAHDMMWYGKPVIVIFTAPVWKDAAYFKLLSKSKFLRQTYFLPKFKHYYECPSDPKDTRVVAKANSQLFVLDNLPTNQRRYYDFLGK